MFMQNIFCRKIALIFVTYALVLTGCNKVATNSEVEVDTQVIPQTATSEKEEVATQASASPVPTAPNRKETEPVPLTPTLTATISKPDSEDLLVPSPTAITNGEMTSLSGYLVFESRRADSNGDGSIDLLDHIQLFLMDLTNSEVVQLTFADHHNTDPSWSPDGNRIVFSANPEGIYNLYTINADGSNIQQLTSSEFDERSPEWSPDGAYIVYESIDRVSLISSLQLISLNSMNITSLDTGNGSSPNTPSWSPDSRYLAFAARYGTLESILILDMKSGELTQFVPSGIRETASLINPIWLPVYSEYMLSVEQVPGNLSASTIIVFELFFDDENLDSRRIFAIEDSFGQMVWTDGGNWLISVLSYLNSNGNASSEFASRELVKLMTDFSTQDHSDLNETVFYNYSIIENSVPLAVNNFYDGDPDWTPK